MLKFITETRKEIKEIPIVLGISLGLGCLGGWAAAAHRELIGPSLLLAVVALFTTYALTAACKPSAVSRKYLMRIVRWSLIIFFIAAIVAIGIMAVDSMSSGQDDENSTIRWVAAGALALLGTMFTIAYMYEQRRQSTPATSTDPSISTQKPASSRAQ